MNPPTAETGKEVMIVSREKDGYRDNLARIIECYPDRELLNIRDVMEFTGLSRNTVRRYIRFNEHIGGLISKADLARQISI